MWALNLHIGRLHQCVYIYIFLYFGLFSQIWFGELGGHELNNDLIRLQAFIPLQWRRNEHDGIWNHQHYDCLLSRLFNAQIKENIKVARHSAWIHRWPVNSPHKGPVTRNAFPFDVVIMQIKYSSSSMPCSMIFHEIPYRLSCFISYLQITSLADTQPSCGKVELSSSWNTSQYIALGNLLFAFIRAVKLVCCVYCLLNWRQVVIWIIHPDRKTTWWYSVTQPLDIQFNNYYCIPRIFIKTGKLQYNTQ